MDRSRLSKQVEIGYLHARYLMQNEIPEVCRRGWEKGLALDNHSNVGHPHSHCDSHNELIFVPDGDAGGLDERFCWKKRIGLGRWKETYMRKTIKREAATRPT